MKMRLLRQALCLLLVLSMLTPVAASAATPLYTYPSISIETKEGVTTNEMAYVDQFFNGYGSYSSKGFALKKWLNNGEYTGSGRVYSGYLMLDEEVKNNSDSNWHMFKEFNARFIGPVAEYFSSGGASIIVSAIEEGVFNLKFPWAGKSAYPYYTQLCQAYVEYVAEVQNKLKQTDDTFDNLSEGIEAVTEIAPDKIRITKKTDILILHGTGKGPQLDYTVTGIDFDKQELIVKSKGTTGVKTKSVPFSNLDKNVAQNNRLIRYDFTDPKVQNQMRRLKTELHIDDDTGMIAGMPYKHIEGRFKNVHEIPGLTKAEKEALSDLGTVGQTETIDISNDLKSVGDIADVLGAANSVIQYANSASYVTAQQMSYLNALTNTSNYYLQMLCQWYQDVESYEVEFKYRHVKNDIKAAIQAVAKDVLDLQLAVSKDIADAIAKNQTEVGTEHVDGVKKEITKYNGKIFISGEFVNTFWSLAETTSKFIGLSNLVERIKPLGSDQINPKVSGVSSLVSVAWNIASADFLDFEDKASTIYNLKWSLEELLVDEDNGLLTQYGKHRNHKTACQIIEALATMRQLKIAGENLMEEYYLCDFYDYMDLETGAAVHAVLRNEMMQRSDTDRLDASDSFIPVIGVCANLLAYKKKAPDDYYPQETISYMDSVILECYLANTSKPVSFKGVNLEPLPVEYSGLPCSPRGLGRFSLRTGKQRIGESVVDGRTGGITDPNKLYLDNNVKLYSHNGVDVFLTGADYEQYLTLEKEINRLLNKYDSVNDIFWREWEQQDHNSSEEKRIETEQKYHERLQWTITTRKWIESVEMYDESVDYSQYAFQCGSVR